MLGVRVFEPAAVSPCSSLRVQKYGVSLHRSLPVVFPANMDSGPACSGIWMSYCLRAVKLRCSANQDAGTGSIGGT